jgi:hypothetical protein
MVGFEKWREGDRGREAENIEFDLFSPSPGASQFDFLLGALSII